MGGDTRILPMYFIGVVIAFFFSLELVGDVDVNGWKVVKCCLKWPARHVIDS